MCQIASSHIYDRAFELRFQQIIQQIDKILPADRFIGIESFFESQVHQQARIRAFLTWFDKASPEAKLILNHVPLRHSKRMGL